jgi:hypothetical protein
MRGVVWVLKKFAVVMPEPEGVKYCCSGLHKNIAATLYKCAEPTFSKHHTEYNDGKEKAIAGNGFGGIFFVLISGCLILSPG